ncbi:MAG: imidazole glycerol phosphate synthase subunit HisH [Candidatus Aminicenantia bacterium]
MIGIIDYGAGNLRSLVKSFSYLQLQVRILSSPEEAKGIERLVIPGVGSFGSAMIQIRNKNFKQFLTAWVKEGKPLLGICLGLQLLFRGSEESPEVEGLSIFPEICEKIEHRKVPHIGWNQVKLIKEDPVLDGIKENEFFYFVHSYAVFKLETLNDMVIGITEYGEKFCSILHSGNIYAVQFHPEKSGETGLKILQNWVKKC